MSEKYLNNELCDLSYQRISMVLHRVNCKLPLFCQLYIHFPVAITEGEKERVTENGTSSQAPGNLCVMSPLLSTEFILSFQLFLLELLNFVDFMGLEIILVDKVNKLENK